MRTLATPGPGAVTGHRPNSNLGSGGPGSKGPGHTCCLSRREKHPAGAVGGCVEECICRDAQHRRLPVVCHPSQPATRGSSSVRPSVRSTTAGPPFSPSLLGTRARVGPRGSVAEFALEARRCASDLQLLVSLFSVEITLQIPASCWCQQSDQGLPQKSSHIKKKSGSLTSCCCLFKEQYLKRLPQQEKAAKLNWNILTVADDKRAVVDGSMQQAAGMFSTESSRF